MKFIGIIPARYASTRFPGKPLAMLGGKTVIQRVYEQVDKTLSNNREPITNNRYYNLHGQRMSKPRKGLNIVDGRKIIIQ